MAMEKTGYSAAIQGTTRVKVATDENGYIAPPGTTAVGTRNFQISKVNADNSLIDNTEVLDFFLTLANGQQDTVTNTMDVKWSV